MGGRRGGGYGSGAGSQDGQLGTGDFGGHRAQQGELALAIDNPVTGKVSRRPVEGGDVDALVGIVERCRDDVQVRVGETVDIEVFEAGYDGFWLQPVWPGQALPAV